MRALRIAVVRHHIAPRAMSATPAPSSSSSPPPRRVLCLHSFRTSSAILHTQMKMARWFDDYARDVEFIAIDAPHAASGDVPADVTAFFGAEGGRYEWWNARDDGAGGTSYDGVEASLRAVELACADADAKGESFDGIMGFSQGATLVGIVLGTPALAARFSFAILVSGMASRATETRNMVLSDVRVPTLHVIGKNDRVMPVTMSEQLFRKFEPSAATMVTHAGGHSVPRLDETGAPILRDFLASLST